MPWQNPLADENRYRQACFLLLAVALLSLAFEIRIVNSISMISLVVITLLQPNPLSALRTAFTNPFFLGCFLNVLLSAFGLLYTHDPYKNLQIVSTKAGLVAISFFFCAGNVIYGSYRRILMGLFNTSLIIVTIICLFIAYRQYSQHHDVSVFFYHQLLSPFKHHAIYFSYFLFFCSVYWIENWNKQVQKKAISYAIALAVTYNFLLILLLSSKIVIVICFLYALYLIFRIFLNRKNYLALAAGSLVLIASVLFVLLTKNPVSQRFNDLKGNLSVLKEKSFAPHMYFNGFQFRLLNWRFTFEILQEEKAWMLGTSPGDAQKKLNDKYVAVNMYQGEGVGNRGYLAYNSHNQFLESTVQSGFFGLITVIWIIIALFVLSYKTRRREPKLLAWSVFAFCFTESVFETQYGIFLFSFFVLLSIYSDESK